MDVRERGKGQSSSRALMNLHNNEAGRKVHSLSLTFVYKVCKCIIVNFNNGYRRKCRNVQLCLSGALAH